VILLELTLYFCLLSLLSVGGIPTVMPEMQRYTVGVRGWLSPEDFVQMFAVGQAAPGPNVLIASLIGWKVAGIPGAFLALAGMCGPSAVLAWWVAELWERFKDSPWRIALQKAMAPIVVGLILAGGFVLATPGGLPAPQGFSVESVKVDWRPGEWRLWLIAALVALATLRWKANPLWFLAAGGVLGGILL
jgi:chromate transporter